MHRFVALALCSCLLAACGQEIPTEETPDLPVLDGELPDVFVIAAEQYDVPAELVMVLGWHESSFVAPDADHDEHRPAFGWMGLTPERVQYAAEVTGASVEAIESDTDVNVRAGAAVLGALRDSLSPDAPTDNVDARWWPVIVAWPELGEEWMDHQFAADVFRTIQVGLDTETPAGDAIVLEGQRIPGLEDVDYVHAPFGDEQERSSVGYPDRARWYPAHSSNQSARSGGTSSINRVVIHTTEGSYNGAISWFRTGSANVSAHYVLRKSDGEVTQMVGDDDKAWHACNNNGDTIGIEHEGASSNPATWTDAMFDSSARLTAWLVTQYDIPIDRDHIVGHGEIQPASCSGRSDPGPYFDWDAYIALVAGYAGAPSPPPPASTSGPLTFLQPTSGDVVPNPVDVRVQHPDSHIELWSGPALLVPYLYASPAEHQHTFSGEGARSLTARAYRLSGAHLATRTVHFEVGTPSPGDDDDAVGDDDDTVGDDDDDATPEPVDTTLYATTETHISGTTMRFTATAGAGVARVEYWIDGWRLPDDVTDQGWGDPADYALTYTFNFTGARELEARAFDASDSVTGTINKTITVPDVTTGCPADVCVDAFPHTESNTTTGSLSAWDSYSCAPGTDESGPEVVYALTIPQDGFLTATVSDATGVDVDVHILSALDPSTCLDRDDTSAGALVQAGTVYLAVDSWVSSAGTVYDGDYDLTLGLATATGYISQGLDPVVMSDAIDVFGAAWEDGETDSLLYTIIDFSLPSTAPRLWTLDLTDGSLIWNLHVSHGEASSANGQPQLSDAFSNTDGSHQSSLGLARTAETYNGSNGYSLRLDGLDPGYNDAVRSRYIVVHGATYSRPEFAQSQGYLGRSWGCPAVDDRQAQAFIDDIKGGSLMLSWYADGDWSNNSPWLQ